MIVTNTIAETRAALRQLRASFPEAELGLVPTMGALHAGHLSLFQAARRHCGLVAATIFVNPLQFAPNEDLALYPRTLSADVALLEHAGVDLLFAPNPEEMYPAHAATTVDAGPIASRLDGASRPTHFRGVTTVVSKLFHILTPDHAFFGQKDAAQVAVLRAMVRDLNFPLTLHTCPTVREHDGLALSSRNLRLTAGERRKALALSRALAAAQRLYDAGVTDALALRQALLANLDELTLDYAEIIDPDTLLPVDRATAGTLFAVAASVGNVRLIDNLLAGSSPLLVPRDQEEALAHA
jgi:pantoate--beta-alanine ligase